MSHILQHSTARIRRLWLAEALLVAGILVFAGFALLSDSRLTPAELFTGLSQFTVR